MRKTKKTNKSYSETPENFHRLFEILLSTDPNPAEFECALNEAGLPAANDAILPFFICTKDDDSHVTIRYNNDHKLKNNQIRQELLDTFLNCYLIKGDNTAAKINLLQIWQLLQNKGLYTPEDHDEVHARFDITKPENTAFWKLAKAPYSSHRKAILEEAKAIAVSQLRHLKYKLFDLRPHILSEISEGEIKVITGEFTRAEQAILSHCIDAPAGAGGSGAGQALSATAEALKAQLKEGLQKVTQKLSAVASALRCCRVEISYCVTHVFKATAKEIISTNYPAKRNKLALHLVGILAENKVRDERASRIELAGSDRSGSDDTASDTSGEAPSPAVAPAPGTPST
ncbi:MAG: hypothetical protein P1U34_01040 [Coxiellaceae bacterium]|nr:hypothetical protein [Coxiellaceae bacterium]